VKLKFSKY